MGEHLAHILRHQAQELILDGGQVQLIVAQEDTAGSEIHLQLAVDEHGGRCRLRRLHHCQASGRHADTRQQLLHREGLGQVVVRAVVQRLDLIAVLAAGADDDDGHIGPGADAPDDLHAVHIREAQIQQHDIRVAGGRLTDGFVSAGSDDMLVFMGPKGRGDEVAHRRVVLHDQDLQLIH